MLFTRCFGALRGRTVLPTVTERDEDLEHYGDVRSIDRDTERAEPEESVA